MSSDELLEYQVQLLVVPRLCEHCVEHLAVYYDYSMWPDTYLCRTCLEQRQAAPPPSWLARNRTVDAWPE